MSDATSASVWDDDGPTLTHIEATEQKAKSPPPLPTSKPVVKTTEVPTGDLIQFESVEERLATNTNATNGSYAVPPSSETLIVPDEPSMEQCLRDFLKEEETYTQQDYLRCFYRVRIEQENLRREPDYRSDCAIAPQHFNRNRYRDILPYDHNRVEISKDEDNPEGYMNASLIQLPDSSTTFIAAQAPLPATLDEWWSMIDEHRVSLIVILCKLVELNKVKCERYWPEEVGQSELFGDYEITLEEEKRFDADDEYLLRVLKMERQSTGESRKIHQLHYREWPDHGCPSGVTQLLNMIDLMETLHDEVSRDLPILVHCSAGVGRTGTIIAINYIREKMKAEKLTKIDIFGLVMTLRKQRASMVQTQDQYQFVHRCIATYCRRHLGIEEPVKPDDLTTNAQLPVGSSGSVRLIAPPTPTTVIDQITTSTYHPEVGNNIVEDETDVTNVPDFPEEPPAPMGPEDLGSSAAF